MSGGVPTTSSESSVQFGGYVPSIDKPKGPLDFTLTSKQRQSPIKPTASKTVHFQLSSPQDTTELTTDNNLTAQNVKLLTEDDITAHDNEILSKTSSQLNDKQVKYCNIF